MIAAKPVDFAAERCGHNYPPEQCPHDHCGYREALARIEEMQAAVKKHHDQHADDLCWMDDDELYAAFGLPAKHATTGDPKAMLRNCKRFIRLRCQGAGDWPTYAELESRIKELEEHP